MTRERRILLLVSLALLGYLPYCFSQQENFKLFTIEAGLKSHLSHSFTQDEQGFIWFLNGLNLIRFDGYDFLEFEKPPEELAGGNEKPDFLATYQDSLLMIVTFHHVLLLHPKSREWRSYHPSNIASGKYTFTEFITTANEETILIASVGAERDSFSFFKLGENGLQLLPFFGTDKVPADLHLLQRDAQGNFYFIKKNTAYKTNPQGELMAEIPIDPRGRPFDINYDVKGAFDDTGRLVILNNSLFYQENQLGNAFHPHPINRFLDGASINVVDFIFTQNDNIWTCGFQTNLTYYDRARDTLIDYKKSLKIELNRLPYSSIDYHNIFEDRTGIIWAGGQMGFTKIVPPNLLFNTFLTEKNCNDLGEECSLRAFAEDEVGNIYISYYNNIRRLNPRTQTLDLPFPGLGPAYLPFDLHIAGGYLWINNGNKLDLTTKQLIPVKNRPIRASDSGGLAEDHLGQLYLASVGQLRKLVRTGQEEYWQKKAELFNPSIRTEELYFAETSKQLWISGNRELLSYDVVTQNLQKHDLTALGLPLLQILALEEDAKGNLWMGTSEGLFYVHPTEGVQKSYFEKDGLANNYVCGLLTEGDSCLWLSTNYGLSRFHIQEETFTNFYKEDGLPDNEFNRQSYFKASDGAMYFGGLRGFISFFPQQVMQQEQINNTNAQLLLASLEYINEREDTVKALHNFSHSSTIHLYHWDRSFTFKYLLTDYSRPEGISFSYLMEGYETNWSAPSKFNFTRYSSLPPGEYVFRVKARDSKGRWHPNELRMQVIMHPPWWKTWWAYAFYFALAGAIVVVVIRFLTRRWILKNQLQQKELLLKEIHHRVKNNLQMISSLLSLQSAHIDDAKVLEAIEQSQHRVQSVALIHQKLYQGDQLASVEIKDFLHSLGETIIDTYGIDRQQVQIEYWMEEVEMNIDTAIPLGLIANELLTNTFKYAFPDHRKGKVCVKLEKTQENEYIFSVTDNGVGMDSNEYVQEQSTATALKSGFGTHLIHMLVQQMEGELQTNTTNGMFTEIRFKA